MSRLFTFLYALPALAGLLLALPAAAQPAAAVPADVAPTAGAVDVKSREAERARIKAERSRLESGFDAEEAACYGKFLVNNCVDKVTARRQAALGDLRRQEIYLDDQERKLKGAEQLRKIEEKRAAAGRSAESDSRAQALREFQERTQRAAAEKPVERARAASEAQRNVEAQARKNEARDAEARARADKQAAAAAERRKFDARQAEARERRARHDRAQRQSRSTAKPLPVPP